MADTPQNGETAKPGDSQTTVTTTTPAPAGNAVDQAEVERLRKEAEQARMRANQLEKEAEARKKADEEREAKELEENNKFKDLWEQSEAKRKELEAADEAREKQAELDKTRDDALSSYSSEVKQAAADLGLDLNGTDTADVDAFTAKLDKLKERIEDGQQARPNNGQNRNTKMSKQEALQEVAKGSKSAANELIKQIPWVADHQNK